MDFRFCRNCNAFKLFAEDNHCIVCKGSYTPDDTTRLIERMVKDLVRLGIEKRKAMLTVVALMRG